MLLVASDKGVTMDKRLHLTDEERKSMPSRKQVREFWDSDEGRAYLSEKTGIVRSFEYGCFACGCPYDLERCHIRAKSKGGSFSVSNLHLLCANCHQESEDFSEGDERYWRWFRKKYIRDFKEPFQWLESRLELSDLSFEFLLKLVIMGKVEQALEIVESQMSSIERGLFEKLFKNFSALEGLSVDEAQAVEIAKSVSAALNSRVFSYYEKDEWEGEKPDSRTH